MPSNSLEARRRDRRRRRRPRESVESLLSEEIETINLNNIPSSANIDNLTIIPSENFSSEEIETVDLDEIPLSANTNNTTTIVIPSSVEEEETEYESALAKIIERKRRKDWAKFVAPVEEDQIKAKKESLVTKLKNLFSKIPSPIEFLLDHIEHHHGYTIRSYFQFVVWLFYLNIFTFIICFLCIVLPTFIYPNPKDFSTYAMNQYYQINSISIHNQSTEQCTLNDPQCKILNTPATNKINDSNETCLSDSFLASSCCSLHTEAFFLNSSSESENDQIKFLSDLISGTGFFTLNRLFIGYYRNLTKSDTVDSYFQTYNMGLAVFLTIFACLLITGIIIIRKYGDGMKKSYVQDESFENNVFQYVFARWSYSTTKTSVARRYEHRFKSEIKSILLERNDKINFKFNRPIDKILFQIQRIIVWIVTLIIFAGAIAAVYFTNRFSFQERAKEEMDDGASQRNNLAELAIEYLPSTVVSLLNLVSQLIFAYMRNFKLYTHATAVRHYLIRVIIMRLLLLFTFVFIVILQITCNSNQCGRQSKIINCVEIPGEATFIHCWETLIGQAIYRLIITDTVVMVIIHLIVDPLRSLLTCCCSSKSVVEQQYETINATPEPPEVFCLWKPLQFELEDYVLDLTYTQTLCWHGLIFCPFLPLIAAAKNILIFAVKWLSLAFFRKRSQLELSPARARHIFTAVLLFSFIWALLPISFLATSLRPSRGCGPFRLYSHEPEYYMYYSVRNIVTQIQNEILVNIILKITSAVVIIPLVLILILFSCILTIRRNSYRGASLELYKLLYTSHKVHQLAVKNAPVATTYL
ncbi:unnamed protein product [Rotaria sp. Silwood2]|nr:unnamed protein product [Rotaria sp. Silwood2]CAF2742166.1 unnamed protein product [Rotaria sp. Silwood2]CAF4264788.1 unnamed protein product [Rotaria sp. Silwood2]CAF4365533.1 unnamed protein product [Rotaria sp. Silwood2]